MCTVAVLAASFKLEQNPKLFYFTCTSRSVGGPICCSRHFPFVQFVTRFFIMALPSMKISAETLAAWAEGDDKIHLMIDYVQLDLAVSNAMINQVGIDPEAHASDIAYISDEEWLEMIADLTVEGEKTPLVQRSRLRQLIVACRAAAHASDTGGEGPGDDQAEAKSNLGDDGKSQVSITPGGNEKKGAGEEAKNSGTVTPDIIAVDKTQFGTTTLPPRTRQEVAVVEDLCTVKLSEVALQGTEARVALIATEKMREGKKRYRTMEGADPEPEEAPTREQASAFLAI